MNDTVLLNVAFLINAQTRKSDKEKTKIICENLLKFSFEKGLLDKNPFNSNGVLKENIIKESNLTDIGKLIFDELADRWFIYTDNENGNIDRKNNTKMLNKYYAKIIKENETKGK